MHFTHLHVHSAFSPNWGIHSPATLCAAAKAAGMTRLALTDRNGMYGIPCFLEAAQKAGIAPLIGAEAVSGSQRAVLLARNQDGYANLCRLLSALHDPQPFDLAVALATWREGLYILSDNAAVLGRLAEQSREGLFVETSPGHRMEQAMFLARRLGLPPVATSRAVFLQNADIKTHRVLRAIAGNTTLSRLSAETCAGPADFLRAETDLKAAFPHYPEALENAARIADNCQTNWDFSATIFPRFRGLADQQASTLLERRAHEGAIRRYGEMNTKIAARLSKELTIIRDKGFAHYFLVVQELAKRSPRTCGRGSAAASLVAYCLGITHVDPLRYNLFFERFLNKGRIDPPDIDIDFPWDERDAVLDFAFQRYGNQRAAMVANQVGFKSRGALREVAKVFGMPADEIKTITRRLSSHWSIQRGTKAMDSHPLFRGESLSSDWQDILAIATRLNGQLRHLSQHCGGLVIVPDDIRQYVPTEVSAKGRPLIQWEKDQTEAAGLVKIDILGNRSLAVIRDALTAVHHHTGNNIDYRNWQPLTDAKTRALLCSGDTIGCFYIESPATRQLLKKMWGNRPMPDEDTLFEHLVMASSIIRPAANNVIREFVARMHGKPWHHLHPLLEPILDETYGLAVYQEQITQIAMALSGFSASEGDRLRKIISKKDKGKTLDDYRQRFMQGGNRNGISAAVLKKIWQQVLSFAGYSFCKPHSASYALVSCKAAWLKANHPAEFMAAVISNGGGYYTPLGYLSEARRMGLHILTPDINTSDRAYRGKDRDLRIGLMQIAAVAQATIEVILNERRKNGPFSDYENFLWRLPHLPVADIKQLIKAGCFDALEGSEQRPGLIWRLLQLQRGPATAADTLFVTEPEPPPVLPPYDAVTLQTQELETLGMPVGSHPLVPYAEAIRSSGAVPAAELSRWIGRHITLVGWWVTGKPVRTVKGQPMEFVTFEDATALFDATFFPAAYARFCRNFGRSRPYLIKGVVDEEFGVATINVMWLGFLDEQGKTLSKQNVAMRRL
ncbi:DNA polymerase III, alpha subunit [Syntrophotalea carbinolica DSM 2380]|uniref:DNA-directed DNA polymerase n=1 Tax=Syntrophotalea carbinolica (strain DSM 2380 / NBRC 103641 / GraBd1) TaxID=338963 RepID=Q3A3S3_SYNC1|nr:DNA polymerase III subunit alpha [Syntrophotalea carbinolica]ABA88984.3 DNA polymerase III, alpha subunit [Syntrophotalea carbinolica DSM 2380]